MWTCGSVQVWTCTHAKRGPKPLWESRSDGGEGINLQQRYSSLAPSQRNWTAPGPPRRRGHDVQVRRAVSDSGLSSISAEDHRTARSRIGPARRQKQKSRPCRKPGLASVLQLLFKKCGHDLVGLARLGHALIIEEGVATALPDMKVRIDTGRDQLAERVPETREA